MISLYWTAVQFEAKAPRVEPKHRLTRIYLWARDDEQEGVKFHGSILVRSLTWFFDHPHARRISQLLIKLFFGYFDFRLGKAARI
jgi:hypothetical protein